ncbi:hypothetical protein Q8A73_004072 [Channa argus]|nr:hypothetical protein Q8A73_004066 [Channa argus]KAK2917326.1 hypothetical protein Q8A73_004072 [Channa argus]
MWGDVTLIKMPQYELRLISSLIDSSIITVHDVLGCHVQIRPCDRTFDSVMAGRGSRLPLRLNLFPIPLLKPIFLLIRLRLSPRRNPIVCHLGGGPPPFCHIE